MERKLIMKTQKARDFKTWKLLVLLVLLGCITYVTSLLNGFVWDDAHFFLQNVFAGSLKYLPQIFSSNTTAGAGETSNYYRPLTTLSFALDHVLWFGWNAFGMHLTNMLIHILNGCLLFLWFVKLKIKKPFSFIIAAIFLVHPIQTEAVTYLSSRGDILYTLFLFLSLYCYTWGLYDESLKIHIKKFSFSFSSEVLLLFSVLLFPLSILSKEGALTTGPMYAGILLYVCVQKKVSLKNIWQTYRDHILVLFPLAFITLFYFYLRLTFLDFGNSLNYSQAQDLYGTHLSVRMFTFLKVFLLDIGLLGFPYPLYLERTTSIVTSFMSPWVIGAIVVIASLLALGFWEIKKRKSALVLFSLIIIFSNLFSVSGIIPMTGLIRENWLYVPMVGFFIIAFFLIQLLFPAIIKYKILVSGALFILILVCMVMTIHQNFYWKDDITYFTHNLDYTNTARLHLNLGNAYLHTRDYKDALYQLKEAVRLDDSYPQTHYNLGAIYLAQNKLDLAEKEYLTSLDLDPTFLYAYAPLVNLYIQEKEPKKALPYIKRLTLIYPNDYRMLLLYTRVLYQAGDDTDALDAFNKAVALSHNDSKVVYLKNSLK